MMSIPPDVSRENFRIDGDLQIEGSLLPSEGSAFDLGSDARRFRDLYLGDPITGYVPTIHFGDQTLTANDILAIKYLATEDVLLPGNVSFHTDLYDTPTTLAGYGITDAATFAQGERADSVYSSVHTTSGIWDDTYTSVSTTSGIWDDTYTSVSTTSSTWDNVYTSVGANSSRWEDVYNNISNNTSQFLNINTVGSVTAGSVKSNGNVEMTGVLLGPEVFYIDPAGHGDNTGKVVISGDLQVDGVTTTVNSSTLSIVDKLIEISKGSSTGADANGAGIHVQGADATWTYNDTSTSWDSNKGVRIVSTDPVLVLHKTGNERRSILAHDGNGLYFRVTDNSDTTRFMNAGNGTNLLINHNTNRVGINTTTPSVALHVNDTDAIKIPKGTTAERPSATTATHQGYIRYNTTTNQFEGFGAGNSWGSLGGVMDVDQDTYISPESSPGTDDDMLRFFTGGSERMRVDGSGNVGIGTGVNLIQQRLHVYRDPMRVSHNIGANTAYTLLNFASDRTIDDYGGVNSVYWRVNLQTPTNDHRRGDLRFGAKTNVSDSTIVDRVTFTHDGKVGIGTTDPTQKLDVNGHITGDTYGFRSDSPNRWYHFDHFTGGNFIGRGNLDHTSLYDASKLSMVWKAGNVGIGTTNPGAKLHIYGDGPALQVEDNSGPVAKVYAGDTEVQFGSWSNHPVRFNAGASEKMRITVDGNVGIGTTSPQRNLDIYDTGGSCAQRIWAISDQALGTASMTGAWTEYGVKIAPGADGGYFTADDVPDYNYTVGIDSTDATGNGGVNFPKFKFGYSQQKWSGPGDVDKDIMVLQPNGNVGIGTTNTQATLHIKANDDTDGAVALWVVNKAHNTSLITAKEDGDVQIAGVQFNSHARGLYGDTRSNAGYVGIGTTNPQANLQIGDSTAGSQWIRLSTEHGDFSIGNGSTNSPNEKYFSIYDQSVNEHRIFIKDNGNVGIGTTSPTNKLHVYGSARIERNGASPLLQFTDQGSSNRWIGIPDATQRFSVYASDGTTEHLSIDSGGNVGIGNTNPSAKLDVPVVNTKVTRFGDDVTSHYVVTGQTDHTLTFTCPSYYQAEVVITGTQTNTSEAGNNLYIRGIWHNNYLYHAWDELEHVGHMSGSSVIISNTHNGGNEQNGKLIIQHNYNAGSFDRLTVRITDFFGTHSYTLT